METISSDDTEDSMIDLKKITAEISPSNSDHEENDFQTQQTY